jgi:hypothetical protein
MKYNSKNVICEITDCIYIEHFGFVWEQELFSLEFYYFNIKKLM